MAIIELNTEDLKNLITNVQEIAVEAGKIILDIYDNADSMEIQQKNDDSPLTIADRKANAHIVKCLKDLHPGIPIISEENKLQPYDIRKEFDYCWLVDPLDGTKEFIKRNGEFTVNIALIKANSIIAGVVYTPVPKILHWAIKGQGAYRKVNDMVEAISCNRYSMTDPGLRVVCSRSHLNEPTQNFIDNLDTPKKVSTGSSLKFLLIAEGKAEVYPRLAPTMEWDTGAAQIILEEAGGRVVRADDNSDLMYNKENLLNPHFIAYGAVTDEA